MRFLALNALVLVAACSPSANQNVSEADMNDSLYEAQAALDAANNALAVADKAATAADPEGWTYSTTSDPMSDEKTELACVQSSNSIYLSPPYGQTGARLCLRNSPQFGRDAYLSLNENGQILCNSYESCSVRIRFDKDPAASWSAIGPSDNSTDMVFIEDRGSFERRLRTSATTNIQVEFYQNGMQTFTFKTAGFNWRANDRGRSEDGESSE